MPQLEALLRGVFEKRRFLDLIRHFIVFEDRDGQIVKKMAGYHQFHAVQRALRPPAKPPLPQGTGAAAWSGIPRARERA